MSNFVKNKLYPLKLWLTSIVFVAPLFMIVINLFDGTNNLKNSSEFMVLVLFIIFGMLFSVPTFLVTFLSYNLLYQKISSAFLLKVIINIISIMGIFITLTLISGSMIPQFEMIYTTSVILSSLVIKVHIKTIF